MWRSRRRLVAAGLALAVGAESAGAARGDDSVLGGLLRMFRFANRPAPARPAPVARPVVVEAAEVPADVFTPKLKKLLTNELHFVRKVCRPDEGQLALIREAGSAEVDAIAEKLSRSARTSYLPDARGLLTGALREKVEEVMPAEAARRYAEELAAREADRLDAAAAMATVLIDRRLELTSGQYAGVRERVRAEPAKQWSRDFYVLLFYEQYAKLPDAATIGPALSERQRAVWAAQPATGTIRFGWEQELGLDWGGTVDLEDEEALPGGRGGEGGGE
jgi:hypothetical protein